MPYGDQDMRPAVKPGVQAPVAPAVKPGVQAIPALKPPSADELNAHYNRMGVGPGSTATDVGVAKMHSPAANAAVRPLAPVAPVARPGVQAPAVPAVKPGVQAPAPQPADEARNFYLSQIRDASANTQRWDYGLSHEANMQNRAMWGQRANAALDAMSRHDAVKAQTAHSDPVATMQRMAAMPEDAKRFALIGRGVDAENVAAAVKPSAPQLQPGQSPFTLMNYATAGSANPATADLAEALKGESPFHEKAALAARIPGVSDANNPNRQLWDAYMARQQARGGEFDQEMAQYNPLNPSRPHYDTSSYGGTLGSIFAAAKDGIFGPDANEIARNQKLARDMGVLGYAGAQAGQPDPAQALLRAQIQKRQGQE